MTQVRDLTFPEIAELVDDAMKTCRCDGGGSTCAACIAERKLKAAGIATDAATLRETKAKLSGYMRGTTGCLAKNKSTLENRAFWEHVEYISRKVSGTLTTSEILDLPVPDKIRAQIRSEARMAADNCWGKSSAEITARIIAVAEFAVQSMIAESMRRA